MMSISHWGMFEFVAVPGFRVLPYGYKFADHNIAEWLRPDGMIELEPVKVDGDTRRKNRQISLLYRAGYLSVEGREQAEGVTA